jgi:hypothetical protein
MRNDVKIEDGMEMTKTGKLNAKCFSSFLSLTTAHTCTLILGCSREVL